MRTNTTDELYVEAPPHAVLGALLGLGRDAAWWPGARARATDGHLAVSAPAGRARRIRFEAGVGNVRPGEGLTWTLERGELRGRAEWWLEGFKSGTVVHYYLDVEPGDRGRARRMSSKVRRHRVALRRGVNALKDRLEGRAP